MNEKELLKKISEIYGPELETADGCLDVIQDLCGRIPNEAHAFEAGDAKAGEMLLHVGILEAACSMLKDLCHED